MFMRRRPLLRAAAVGGGAYMAGKASARRQADQQYQESAQDQRIGNLEQQNAGSPPAASAPSVPAQAGPSMTDQLKQLGDLRNQGVLTDDEFAAAKAKLFGT